MLATASLAHPQAFPRRRRSLAAHAVLHAIVLAFLSFLRDSHSELPDIFRYILK